MGHRNEGENGRRERGDSLDTIEREDKQQTTDFKGVSEGKGEAKEISMGVGVQLIGCSSFDCLMDLIISLL